MRKLQKASWCLVAALPMFFGAACSTSKTPPEASSANAEKSPTALANVASANGQPTQASPAVPSPRLSEPRWKAAMGEDPAGKQALADALGATSLLEALDDGGEIATTALVVLPLADDAELALAVLARRVLVATNEDRAPFLEALLGIAGRPAQARESLDPEGAAEAGQALLTLATNTALPKEHRALAISAARALAEKKIVDPAKIPTDLDPP